MDKAHIEALAGFVGRDDLHVYGEESLSGAEFADYGTDQSHLKKEPYALLVFPRSTTQAAQIIRYSALHKIPIVPSGGRTGLCGGAVAGPGELVLSLKKMNRLLRFDPYLPALHVEAGMITAQVQEAALKRGLFFPVDLAASGSSQIGGNLATNAGGTRVIRYGTLRSYLLGICVVSGKGDIIRIPGRVIKNNAGPDLKQLFIGQEGTLGVITEAVLRLMPAPQNVQVCLLALRDMQAALDLLRELKQKAHGLLAFEYWDDNAMQSVCKHFGLRAPFAEKYASYCLLEWEEHTSPSYSVFSLLAQREGQNKTIGEALIAASKEQANAFWKYREGISESLSAKGLVHKQDLSLPLAHWVRFVLWVKGWIAKDFPNLKAAFFGHLGDANLHLNLFPCAAMPPEEFRALCNDFDSRVYRLVLRLNGSISAEHGLGLLKKDLLDKCHSPAELELMRFLKEGLDPQGILNRGKVF